MIEIGTPEGVKLAFDSLFIHSNRGPEQGNYLTYSLLSGERNEMIGKILLLIARLCAIGGVLYQKFAIK